MPVITTSSGPRSTAWPGLTAAMRSTPQPVDLGPYEVVITDIAPRPDPNFSETVADAEVRQGGRVVATIAPAKRFFAARQQTVAQAGIVTLGLGQVYVSLGDDHPDGSIDTRMFWKPLVSLIWLGALVMGLGGLLSLSDRRLRVGVAVRRPRGAPTGNRPPVLPRPAE